MRRMFICGITIPKNQDQEVNLIQTRDSNHTHPGSLLRPLMTTRDSFTTCDQVGHHVPSYTPSKHGIFSFVVIFGAVSHNSVVLFHEIAPDNG